MFSVVIPMYNSEKTIERALFSVVNQSRYNLVREIIVVDDGSTDKSVLLVENFRGMCGDEKIQLIRKNNGGPSSARNVGMRHSTACWIALLDSDDEWMPNKLEIQVKIISDNPQIQFLGGELLGQNLRIGMQKIDYLHRASVYELLVKMFPQTSTAVFLKSLVDRVGEYDESMMYAEDGHFFLRICSLKNYYYHPDAVVIYDRGKKGFGERGLSSNIKQMHLGQLRNLRMCLDKGFIGSVAWSLLLIFYYFKLLRRMIKANKLI